MSLGVVVASSFAAVGAAALGWSGWRQPRPALDLTSRARDRVAVTSPAAMRRPASVAERLGALVVRDDLGDASGPRREALRLVGRTPEHHAGLLLLTALAGVVAPAAALALAALIGVVTVSPLLPLAGAFVGGLFAPLVVHRRMLERAERIRSDLRHQLSAFLDVFAMLIAGNSAHEGALEHAARAGDGLLFVELRRRMREVAATGRSLVMALSLVADDLALPELEGVAAATLLSATEGSPVVKTLTAKCATLRSTLASEQEASARIRTDKVTPPLVGMALLFMALIVYPALTVR